MQGRVGARTLRRYVWGRYDFKVSVWSFLRVVASLVFGVGLL